MLILRWPSADANWAQTQLRWPENHIFTPWYLLKLGGLHNMFKDKNILVIGSGLSGISAVKLLHDVGAFPYLYEGDAKKTASEIEEKLPKGYDIPIYIGTLPPQDVLGKINTAVISPGINLDNPVVEKLKAADIKIIGEIELAYMYAKGRIIAITGTNGKSTTVTLVGEIMKAHFSDVFVVGNIGFPFCDIALKTTDESVIVLEVSSFQLETIEKFAPYISAILNITPDHLDRHGTMENYIKMKERIAENQDKNQYCVLNLDNEHTASFAGNCPATPLLFTFSKEINSGCYMLGDIILLSKLGVAEPYFNIYQTKLVGTANIENIMAAILISSKMAVPRETIIETIKAFRAVEHRLEYVATHNGVDYYNDSKATNPDAAIQGIRAMSKPTILLAGGSDKKADYLPWLNECRDKVKAFILFGETKDEIAACAASIGLHNIHKAQTIEEVINLCQTLAAPGDAILLSPACASFDMFKNYEDRGNKFKELVLTAVREG